MKVIDTNGNIKTKQADPEGTAVKSTGEAGGTKFLREDGDNSCSWQTAPVTSVSGSTGAVADGDIDHDQLANFASNEHYTQANITATGTVASGTWQGTAIDGTYIDLEGTEVKSTGEGGGTKYLREDGDGTSSWQTVGGGITLATEQASTSGSAIDFTGIPSGTKMIVVMLDGVSMNGTYELHIQLGDSGGIAGSGYKSGAHSASDGREGTTGFVLTVDGTSDLIFYGSVILTLEDEANYTWTSQSSIYCENDTMWSSIVDSAAGKKSLGGELVRVRLTLTGGSFDAGAVNIQYQ